MSKKKFKDGLESLFGGPAIAEPSLPDNSPILEETQRESKKKALKVKAKRSKSGKNFTSDLDTLFETVVEDNIRGAKTGSNSGNRSPKRANRPPVVGLDALIQRTSDADYDYTSTKKRVTFIFEKKKLDKLKQIAKTQNTYLKDIIGNIIGLHIDKFDEEGRLIS